MFFDKEKTIKYYENYYDFCYCPYCKNFAAKFEERYPKISKYLRSLGIDILKPLEITKFKENKNTISFCNCMYVVIGECDEDILTTIAGIDIRINRTGFYPTPRTKDKYIVIDFGIIDLPKEKKYFGINQDIDKERFKFTPIYELVEEIPSGLKVKIHNNFIITKINQNTFINGAYYDDIEDQDIEDAYIDFHKNKNVVYIQYKKNKFDIFKFRTRIKEVKKSKFKIEKYLNDSDVELIFDNKETIFINK